MKISFGRLCGRRQAVLLILCAFCTFPLFAALAAAGCAGQEAIEAEAPEGAEGASAIAAAYDPSILDDPSRSEDDRYRDGGFKPLEVYRFFGVEPGMTVGDLWTAGMYNAHVLSHIVGGEGRVLAIISPSDEPSERSLQRSRDAFAGRNSMGTLTNVELVDSLAHVEDNSLDVLITVRNYHDVGDKEARVEFLPRLMRVLKPGGVLGVVDANSNKPDERDREVHRINGDIVIEELTSAGFEFAGASDVLHNPEDTYDFDGREDDAPIHRYYIDRVVQKYVKPSS